MIDMIACFIYYIAFTVRRENQAVLWNNGIKALRDPE